MLLVCGANRVEQRDQLGDVTLFELAQGALVRFDYTIVEPSEELDAFRRDPAEHLTSVAIAPETADEQLRFETVEKAGDPRRLLDHAIGNLEGRDAAFSCSAKDAKHVVLLQGNAMRFDHARDVTANHVGCSDQGDGTFRERSTEGLALFELFLEGALP